ncbi:nucleoside 2-deoxyribosyltransferase [Fredinandcohnia sp. 179-A 10B2 NHS]|uniref:nucleoside 2-deoxyribosyltransferase n=1 Tax=Fredinandcohnia sp. 179-A 10B2 NHS TaxID=3235176 RepID=UPI0039A382FC
MKFYIASSLQNKEQVTYVSDKLKREGYIHTYDWTKNENVSTLEKLREIGRLEKEAVINSDIVIVLLPGGKGTHIELGIALGLEKKVYLYSPTDEINNVETTSTFYHLPQIEKCVGSVEELIERVVSESK